MRSDIKVGVVLGLAMLAVLGGYYWRTETPDAVRLVGDKKPTQLAQAGSGDRALSPPSWSSQNTSKKPAGSVRDASKAAPAPKSSTPTPTPAPTPAQPIPSTPSIVKSATGVPSAPKSVTSRPLFPATPPLMSSIGSTSQPASGNDKPPLVSPPKSESSDKKADSTADESKPAPIRIPDPTHKPESAASVVKPSKDADTKAPANVPDRTTTPATPKSPTATADKAKPEEKEQVYEVKKNDTLAILSEHFYGSQKYVNFLLKANPQVDARRLKVGTKLRIPPLSGAATSQPAAAGEKAKSASETIKPAKTDAKTPAPGDAKTSESTYTVKASDNFYSIARKTLGSGERWREIHQLNKDVCPEPSNLKPGMKLRLPGPKTESKAATGEKSEAKSTSRPKEAKNRFKT